MRAFNLSLTNRQGIRQCLGVVELILSAAQITVTRSYRCLAIRHVSGLKVRPQGLEDVRTLSDFERVFLLIEPGFGRVCLRVNRRSGGAQVIADMIEIDQIPTLTAEALFHLPRNPFGTIADSMHLGRLAETRLFGARKQLLSGLFHIALQRAAIAQGLAARRMRQAEFGFFPLQGLAFTPVCLRDIGFDNRYHATIHFNDDRPAPRLNGPSLIHLCRRIDGLGMRFSHPPYRAFGEKDPVMLDQFVLDLGEGYIGAKVGHHPLQRPRTSTMAYFGSLHKGAKVLASQAILNLFYADFTKGTVPLEFFLPARRTPSS